MERRKHPRHLIKKQGASNITIEYMGNRLKGVMRDISFGGVGVFLDGLSFSIIDDAMITMEVDTGEGRQKWQACVVYSVVENDKSDRQRYGLQFLIGVQKEVNQFIEDCC